MTSGSGNSNFDVHSLTSNPLLTNTISVPPDFHLQSGSPCDATSATALLAYDYYGTIRATATPTDLGAVTLNIPTSITTSNVSSSYCAGAAITVNFNATGSYTAGNVYTAQLSDASGTFSNPSTIGTLTSSATGNLSITANPGTLPSGATQSSSYVIRVVASTPSITGSSTAAFTINAPPSIVVSPPLSNICTGSSINLAASGGNTYSWAPSTNLSATTGATVTATVNSTITYTVTGTDGNGCTNTATAKTTAAGSFSSGLSGTITVGSSGTYSTFTVAGGLFSAINTNGLSGNLTVQVISDITTETGAVQLGAFPSCGGPYTITIQPDGANLRTIEGGPYVSGTGLIAFNGASNIVIDGSYGGSGMYLKFTNNPSYEVYTVLGFINDANNITVKNCIIEGDALGDNIGCINILTAASIGNCYLTFSNNNIGNNDYIDTRVYCSGTAGHANHDIAFTNNNIFNFLDGGNSMYDYGINITATGNGNNFTITGNSFYETGVCNSGAYHQSAISLLPGSSSTGNIISGNYIGGNLPQCAAGTSPAPGYYCSNNSNSGAEENDIINVNCGVATISNNVIKNMRWTGSNQNVVLLNIAGSTVATVSGNHFGDASSANQVSNTSSYISDIIYTGSSTGTQFTNNSMQNVKCTGAGTNSYGLYVNQTGAMYNLLIQGNSIEIPWSTSSNDNYGINLNGSYNITASILANRIYDNTTGSGGANYGLSLSVPSFSGSSCALTIINNQIALRNPNGNTATALFGIYDNCYNGSGSTLNYYYNSVYIAGTASSTLNSCAYYNGSNGSGYSGPVKSMKNNILINARTGGTGTHTTISNRWGDPNFLATTSDYNLLANATASTLGNWNGTNETFANWKTASGGDANSVGPTYNASTSTYSSNILSPANLFIAPATGDLHINSTDGQSYQFIHNKGVDLTSLGFTTDYSGNTRGVPPDIGSEQVSSGECSTPATPTVTVNNACGNSVLSTTATGGTLLWSTGASSSSITVTNAATYSVTITVTGGCSATGTGTSAPVAVPATPSVSVINNCGSSTLSTSATGTLAWSTGASSSSITVTASGTYSVTTTVSSCASTAGTGTAAPMSIPSAPGVSAVNNCNGTSTLSTTATGTLSWSTGASASSITVSSPGTYSVTTTVSGCISPAGTGTALLSSCNFTFTVKFFIQGYYLSGGTMSPLLKLLNISHNATDVDTVTIELHPVSSPSTVADSYKSIVQSNGELVCTFASGDVGTTYYIVIKHRNSITTWSASGGVTMSSGGSYDFTTAAGQAYNSNMVNLGSGVYGIYSGDINQDNTINSADKYVLQAALPGFSIGTYNINDVTGDGFVDEDDLRIIENNIPLNISVQQP